MVFSNLVFLYIFLPVILFVYFVTPRYFKNIVLLIASLIFYAWGEPVYLFLMLFSILLNYGFGLWIQNSQDKPKRKKFALTFAILINIGLLGYYKYANFLVDIVNQLFHAEFVFKPLPLPIGISFYTFHAISYLVDVYRKEEEAQKNLFNLALYITFFPQLVAGPIIRYNDVAEQLEKRSPHFNQFINGIQRFVLGLSKKVLIANPLGQVADEIFAMSAGNLTTATAWIGILAYTLQIYFDFSGYSDMAIGLGKMFGFEFKENFNYPYIARNVSEFWRRWHISLSSWFRDYVYIPLGGSRVSQWKIYRNILIVWTLTGFWHGASWTFMAWGFYYGIIISLEKWFLGKWMERVWKPLQHMYVLLLVMIGWVFFRADNFTYSFDYIQTLFGFNGKWSDSQSILYFVDNGLVFLLAFVFVTPIFPFVQRKLEDLATKYILVRMIKETFGSLLYLLLLLIITTYLVNSTYNPFIYFRF